MGACNINHSLADVKKKLNEQSSFLPANLVEGLENCLTVDLSQEALNDIFHLLKKYDLATESDREEREGKLTAHLVR